MNVMVEISLQWEDFADMKRDRFQIKKMFNWCTNRN